ncbi:hypothetical protein R1flu_028122 [Riccia fluitans]|uniref:Uncharacterized protein n=1 Tax=Riccia fluitans TaxID=41844 RepID=A0ABD1XKS8_9MARC
MLALMERMTDRILGGEYDAEQIRQVLEDIKGLVKYVKWINWVNEFPKLRFLSAADVGQARKKLSGSEKNGT